MIHNPLLHIGSGTTGIVLMDVLPSTPPTGNISVDAILKTIVAVASILPSVISIFKKNKTKKNVQPTKK